MGRTRGVNAQCPVTLQLLWATELPGRKSTAATLTHPLSTLQSKPITVAGACETALTPREPSEGPVWGGVCRIQSSPPPPPLEGLLLPQPPWLLHNQRPHSPDSQLSAPVLLTQELSLGTSQVCKRPRFLPEKPLVCLRAQGLVPHPVSS